MFRYFSILFCSCLALLSASAGTPSIVIKAGHLVDVTEGKVVDNTVILIEGDSVKAVGPDVTPPAGASIIDLGNFWVLPGLIDCHTHITFQMENYYDDIFRKSPIDEAVYAHVGSIAPGHFADVIAVNMDPLKDVAALERIAFVMKSAVVYRSDLSARN